MTKKYYVQYNIGHAKYCVSYHDGVSTHRDGSAFYGIAIFKNKKALAQKEKALLSEGYIYKG